jgi:hypothetical protein
MGEFSLALLTLAGCVFAASAAAKIRSRPAYRWFSAGLRETGLVPERLLPRAAAVLCAAEAVTGAGLIGAAVATAAGWPGGIVVAETAPATAAVLTGVLAVGVAAVIRRGTQARCACFGAGPRRPLGREHLARNLCLLAVLGADMAAASFGQRPAPAAAIVAAAAGVTASLLFIRWDDLVELFAPMPRSYIRSRPAADTPAVRQTDRAHR